MHGAAFALTVAGGFTVQLGEHGAEFTALGDEVAVPAVGTGDPVRIGKMSHYASGNRFLAHIQMQGAGNLAVFHLLAGRLLELPDPHHAPMDIQQRGVIDVRVQTHPQYVKIETRANNGTQRYQAMLPLPALRPQSAGRG